MSKPPNPLYVFADQLRYQSMGYAGDVQAVTPCIDGFAQAVTPCIDGFAREGVNFTGYIGKWHLYANELGHHDDPKNSFVRAGRTGSAVAASLVWLRIFDPQSGLLASVQR